jgi:predicted aminopeptidase
MSMPCIVTNRDDDAPRSRRRRGALTACALALGMSPLSGCYLLQAAGGQMDVARRSRPIDAVLAEPETTPELRARLEVVRDAREFAVRELGLPDGRSYRQYADLERPYALWNVVATPEFSLQAKQWCFPIAGCVSYRGYFRERDAVDAGRRLRQHGYDVSVGGVATYSTLGHLRDPVFSTMLAWRDSRLVTTIFHEMAHEQLYVPGDTAFNEAYASVVAEAGLRDWLRARGDEAELERVAAETARAADFAALLREARLRLAALYRSGRPAVELWPLKQREFGRLKYRYSEQRRLWGGYAGYDAWFARPLTNADLVAVATYEDCMPGLRRELAMAGSLREFHRRAAALGELSLEHRRAAVCAAEEADEPPDEAAKASRLRNRS